MVRIDAYVDLEPVTSAVVLLWYKKMSLVMFFVLLLSYHTKP